MCLWADRFPWLQRLTPLGDNLSAGRAPAMFTLGRLRIAPNICYETVLSHVIRGQINALAARGEEPNVLVNLTNDGWFWGSSELDMHLACGVFRAVECRKPLLIAANTGFSAWIDGDGRILRQGQRRADGQPAGRGPLGPADELVLGPWRLAGRPLLGGLHGAGDRGGVEGEGLRT